MATLALAAAGSAIGGAVLPGGISLFGATLSGAAIGQAVGGMIGSTVDQALFGSSGQSRHVEGARLSDLQVMGSTEGAPIPRLYGKSRLAGQIIWATHFEEEAITTTVNSGGGKGGLTGSSNQQSQTQTEYRYYANIAVALCEGEISQVSRIWADGKELNLSNLNYRVYRGSEDQMPDSLIEAKEGADNAPAYRGVAYIVFEHLALARFGNRLPQLNFEVFRSVDSFESQIRAVALLPGAGEFVYSPYEITKSNDGSTSAENVHSWLNGTDWDVSINDLETSLPNSRTVSLIVSWFGTDLRAGRCEVKPGVEVENKDTQPLIWSVAGQAREDAYVVSRKDGQPAYGGSPDDQTVIDAIKDLRKRGFKIAFYPFLLMDIPNGNSLKSPYSDELGQPVYPWRGRIVPDPVEDITSEIHKFVGSAAVSDYSISGESVLYGGAEEWSFRRMILHYAHLCKAAGGVDKFFIGSELRGLTTARIFPDQYLFVDALEILAGDVKSVLGNATDVTYAADWSEYFGHQPDDGSDDVLFHLDPLWASPHIDAIGIDIYWPLSDWRDGELHQDYIDGHFQIYDLNYLKSNIMGGEGYDWYYRNYEDRISQTRTAITDGNNSPWIFRYKDIKNWWLNRHHNRLGGVEVEQPTAWIPQSKPIWFTEVGCPAIDKGTNQPNVFHDPKSSESKHPYFSHGYRDDMIQRRYIQAILEFFNPDHETFVEESNPRSSVYNGRMVDVDNIYVYAWDARPYPAFPYNDAAWGDRDNWPVGHWLTGRTGNASLAATIEQILVDYKFYNYAKPDIPGTIHGYVIDRPMSPREALQPLELSFFFDSHESAGAVHFTRRGQNGAVRRLTVSDLVDSGDNQNIYTITRRQETELPASVKLTYINGDNNYYPAVAEASRLTVGSGRLATANLAIVMNQPVAVNTAETWLHDSWASREEVSFELPPSSFYLEPTDVVILETEEREYRFRLTGSAETEFRTLSGLSIDEGVYGTSVSSDREFNYTSPPLFGSPLVAFMDLPALTEGEDAHAGYLASYQSPWPGGVAFHRSPEEQNFALNAICALPATMGETKSVFPRGPASRWDRNNKLVVKLYHGQLLSVSELACLSGQNVAAIDSGSGFWEIIQYQHARLIDEQTYELSNIIRGQAGTEDAIKDEVPQGARFVLIDRALKKCAMTRDEIGLPFYWVYGPVGYDIGHSSYRRTTIGFNARGLAPFSPVHVRAASKDGDITISWIRRTRVNGDSWETHEVPLNEDFEAYEVDIMENPSEGDQVKRVLFAEKPAALYSKADQLDDWGSIQSYYRIRVYQISATIGRGVARETVISV